MEMKLIMINKCLQGCLVKKGHKQRALNIYAQVLEYIRTQTDTNPLLVLVDIVETYRPTVNLWSKRVGGTSYKIPYLISEKKSLSIVIHSLVHNAALRTEKSYIMRFGCLIMECVQGRGYALEQAKNEINKIALYNRAFLKYK